MSDEIKIANAEMEIMRILWRNSPLSAKEIKKALSERKTWDPGTIKSLINRLHTKKAIGFETRGNRYFYFPLISQESCIQAETESFVSKFGGGLLKTVVSAFLDSESLSDKEIAELKQLLDEKGKGTPK
ncbi:MAG: BlaI/MecI/CopY family transcriptional regulator [Myxococcota bacterium]|nr:BlaI/MecI/CopY family transcriptional regulator [Myxococcota bacterium]